MERIDLYKLKGIFSVKVIDKISDELFVAEIEDGTFLINKNGVIISSYDYNNEFNDCMEDVEFYSSCNRYDIALKFNYGRSVVAKDGRYGYIDVNGKEITELKYCYAESFSDELAFVDDGEYQYYIDIDGNMMFQVGQITSEPFNDGYSVISNVDGVFGLMDKNGDAKFNSSLDNIKTFSDSLAPARDKNTGLWGFINSNVKFEILPKFDNAEPFVNGRALVKKGELELCIYNKTKVVKLQTPYDDSNKKEEMMDFNVVRYCDNIDDTEYFHDIKLVGYYTCFMTEDRCVEVEDDDYDKYIQKVAEVESILKADELKGIKRKVKRSQK